MIVMDCIMDTQFEFYNTWQLQSLVPEVLFSSCYKQLGCVSCVLQHLEEEIVRRCLGFGGIALFSKQYDNEKHLGITK